ncbi:response regulator transcription factor [Chthonobacter rhizosphaerae]|uniref:response regulator transcription factor n=1 Tax=Chthonobacter rhizosphaerae TaxID=2735553 RepID=UPI0015EE7DD3|nr:response regulator transcription factor [Chthonobacter rhizosphaerae]
MTAGDPVSRRDTVLVVDDSPQTLRLLTDALDETGAMVLVALGGEEALELVRQITPDIILMDAVMPGLDGFETCRRLKAGPLAHVPVIFMTGLSETEHIVKGLEAGGVDYVTKPLVIDALLARIRVHLANARAAQSARAALDTAGRHLLATDGEGRVRWSTPQAARLLVTALPGEDDRTLLPDEAIAWLKGLAGGEVSTSFDIPVPSGPRLTLSFVGRVGGDEYLFRLTGEDLDARTLLLRERFQITNREAEVLLWITHGKSNRDIAEILGLSPRTVNKHLEQVYAKLGVENRSSAAVVALRALGDR